MLYNLKKHKIAVLFQLSVIIAMLSVNRMLFYIPFFLLGVYLFSYLKKNTKADRDVKTFVFFLLLTLIFGTVVNVFWQPTALFHFIISVIACGSAYIMTRDLEGYYVASKFCLILYQLTFILVGLSTGLSNFPFEIPYEEFIPGASANVITSLAVVLQLNFIIVSLLLKNRSAVGSSFLTLVIALIGYGRGSIIASLLLVLITVLISLALKSKIKAFVITVIIVILGTFALNKYFDQLSYYIENKTKLSRGMVDEGRSDMLNEYISKLDSTYLLVGASYEGTVIETRYGGNPHSSFIRAHHVFGVFYLLFVIITPLFLVFKIRKLWKRIIVWMLFGIFYFRAFSEPVIWPTVFDFYYFSVCFIMLKDYNVKREH